MIAKQAQQRDADHMRWCEQQRELGWSPGAVRELGIATAAEIMDDAIEHCYQRLVRDNIL